jgi:hypothetical protein
MRLKEVLEEKNAIATSKATCIHDNDDNQG